MSDDDLEELFAKLRSADRAPPFAPMYRPRKKRTSHAWLLALPAAAVLILVLWRVLTPRPVMTIVITPRVDAPLDFLLETPAAVRGVPDFDHEPR
jgi:hypothetical protein